ncbi:MAG: hypothetical protein GWP59_03335 [Chlamydiales bacterium]|nr:hypothetical protein [Chlamydiales bacterium]NCF70718.1 hypothetical protein [Chlamydiales bacterium]
MCSSISTCSHPSYDEPHLASKASVLRSTGGEVPVFLPKAVKNLAKAISTAKPREAAQLEKLLQRSQQIQHCASFVTTSKLTSSCVAVYQNIMRQDDLDYSQTKTLSRINSLCTAYKLMKDMGIPSLVEGSIELDRVFTELSDHILSQLSKGLTTDYSRCVLPTLAHSSYWELCMDTLRMLSPSHGSKKLSEKIWLQLTTLFLQQSETVIRNFNTPAFKERLIQQGATPKNLQLVSRITNLHNIVTELWNNLPPEASEFSEKLRETSLLLSTNHVKIEGKESIGKIADTAFSLNKQAWLESIIAEGAEKLSLTVPRYLRDSLNDADMELIISACPNLEHVDLSYCYRINDRTFIALPRLEKLKSLDISNTYVRDRNLPDISAISSLENLQLNDCHLVNGSFKSKHPEIEEELTLPSLAFLSSLKSLRTFSFNFTTCHPLIRDGDFDAMLHSCTQLKSVSLQGFVKLSDCTLRGLSQLPKLEKLDISSCRAFKAETLKSLIKEGNFSKLNYLDMMGSSMDNDLAKAICFNLRSLEYLNFGSCSKLSAEGFLFIRFLNKLKYLKISHNPHLTDDIFSKMGGLKSLIALNISFCDKLTFNSLLRINNKLSQVKHLNIAGCDNIDLNEAAVMKDATPNFLTHLESFISFACLNWKKETEHFLLPTLSARSIMVDGESFSRFSYRLGSFVFSLCNFDFPPLSDRASI